MNDLSRARLDLVRDYVRRYTANPHCRAVLVVGSVARGVADDNSDVDTTLVYDQPLSDAEFEAMRAEATATGGGFHHGTPTDFAVYHFVDGVKLDFGHGSLAAVEADLRGVLEQPTTELIPQLIASGFLEGVALYGEDWVESWKARLRAYPPALAEAMVRKHLRFFPHWAVDTMGVARHDTLWVYEVFVETLQNIVGVLFGLNHAWHPGKLKGLEWWLERLALKPAGLNARIERVLRATPAEGLRELVGLVEDTITLVETHMPQVETAAVRNRFSVVLRR